MNGHPEVEALAAYAAGDLTASEASPVAQHVVACASCAADLAAIRQVEADLATLPPLTMPAGVAASIDAALAAERAPAPVVQLESKRRRWTLAPLVTGAAAAALVGAIGYGVISRGPARDGGTAFSGGAKEQAAPPAGPIRYYASGYAYQQDNVVAGALQLIQGTATQDAARTGAGTGGAAQPDAVTTREFSSGDDTEGAVTALRLAPSDLERCLDLLRESPSVTPVAIDYSSYEGQPAIVVVLPFRQGQYDVYLVTPRCGRTDDPTILHFQRVSA